MNQEEMVDINIKELDGGVRITIEQFGKTPAQLNLPTEQAVTFATTILRIAHIARNKEKAVE